MTGELRQLLHRAMRRDVKTPEAVTAPTRGALLDEVIASAATLRRLLEQNIIPFWSRGTLDEENGGYLVNHDDAGSDSVHLCVPFLYLCP